MATLLESSRLDNVTDDTCLVDICIYNFKAAIYYSCHFKSAEFAASEDIKFIESIVAAAGVHATDEDTSMKSFDLYARAFAGLGVLYMKVLRMSDLGRSFLVQAVKYAQFATKDTGEVYFHKLWFQQASAGIDEDNIRQIHAEEAQYAAETADVAVKLKADVDMLSTLAEKTTNKA
eukprot:gene45722-56973_t